MADIGELIAQKAAIEQQIIELRKKDKQTAISRIREIAADYDLTAEDIFGKKTIKPKVAPKYRDPVSGKTWTGRGMPPRWLDGQNRDDFLIR